MNLSWAPGSGRGSRARSCATGRRTPRSGSESAALRSRRGVRFGTLAPVLAPAAAPRRGPRRERAVTDPPDRLDEAGLERVELRVGAGRPEQLARLGEVEPEARRRGKGLAGRRIAQAAPGTAERVGGELCVGVDVGLAAGPAGLVVDDLGRAVASPVDAIDVADEPEAAGVAGELDADSEPDLDRDRLSLRAGLDLQEAGQNGDGPQAGLLDLGVG